MNVFKAQLGEIRSNDKNPRTITDANLTKLVRSIIEFPEMLDIRPIVVDDSMTILGGNMRYRALNKIATMTIDEIRTELSSLNSFKSKTGFEVNKVLLHWENWLKSPYLPVTKASELSESDREAFIIKDNVAFGSWDFDILSTFQKEDLSDWGVLTWSNIELDTTDNDDDDDDTPEVVQEEAQGGRIIILYPPERQQELLDMLGLDEIKNRSYTINDLR